MMNESRILEILENEEYRNIKTCKSPGIPVWFYEITTNNGGMIRIFHENKVLFCKEKITIAAFVPNKSAAVFMKEYKSNHDLFNKVYNIWYKIYTNETIKSENDESKYF